MTVRAALLALGLALGGCGSSPDRFGIADPSGAEDGKDRPGEEAVVLPAYPADRDLIEFQLGQASANRYFVDSHSVRISAGGIAYYTVIVRAGGGAVNVIHEGMHCRAMQKRSFAFGHAGKQWSAAKHSPWAAIRFGDPNEYQATLFRYVFCPYKVTVRDREEALRALRAGARSPVVE